MKKSKRTKIKKTNKKQVLSDSWTKKERLELIIGLSERYATPNDPDDAMHCQVLRLKAELKELKK